MTIYSQFMLYDVITYTGRAVTGVSLYDAKRFLRAFYDGFSMNQDFKVKLKGRIVYGSIRGLRPFILAHIIESKIRTL